MFQKASGPIKAGQLVSGTTPHVYIQSSLIHLHLGLPSQALIDVDIALEHLKGEIDEKKAWNNKGVILGSMGKISEAAKCYEKAIELDSDFTIAKKNLDSLPSI
jgi:tetratricopeptide (TPR) repeat protein